MLQREVSFRCAGEQPFLLSWSTGSCSTERSNPSIERTASGGLRPPPAAAHVKR